MSHFGRSITTSSDLQKVGGNQNCKSSSKWINYCISFSEQSSKLERVLTRVITLQADQGRIWGHCEDGATLHPGAQGRTRLGLEGTDA